MNVHGCGIGWYARERCGLVDELGLDAYNRPTVYTTVAAPSHDRNLRALSKAISSSLLFGHVRAAGPGASVHQYNCHPFFKGRYMFMHNGDITDFSKIRRGLQGLLRDDLFDHMSGTTDSELLFLLILNSLPDCHTQLDPSTLQQAVLDAFCEVIKANKGKANSLNIAFTDGETTIATRYRNSDVEEPPSLYYHVGPMPGESAWDLNNADLGGFDAMENNPDVHDHSGRLSINSLLNGDNKGCKKSKNDRGEKFVATQALLVSSEPLTGMKKGLDRWELLPSNSMIVAAPVRPTVGRCTRAALVSKLKEITQGGGKRHNLSESSAPVLEIEVKCIRSLCRDALGDDCPDHARGVTPPLLHGHCNGVNGVQNHSTITSPKVSNKERADTFAPASLPNKGFLHGHQVGPAFRSNSSDKLLSDKRKASRRQSVDVGGMTSPLKPNGNSDTGEALAGLAQVQIGDPGETTAILGFDTGDDNKKTVGSPPKRNLSFTEGSTRVESEWTSYNPATGPRG